MFFYEFFGVFVKFCIYIYVLCGIGMLLLLIKILIKGDRIYLNGCESLNILDIE